MTPYDALLRFFINNGQPMSLPDLAQTILTVLNHAGFAVVKKEMADAG